MNDKADMIIHFAIYNHNISYTILSSHKYLHNLYLNTIIHRIQSKTLKHLKGFTSKICNTIHIYYI